MNDTRALLRIVVLYSPLPLFWTLFDQQVSRWTFQANKMNGDIEFYTIKPDQMLIMNPLLVLLFIPLFDAIIYPIIQKIGIRRPLQKMAIGLGLAVVSFLLSAMVQFQIESSPEKSVHMLWLLPQYAAISLAEVSFAATGMSFSYGEAPASMKSVVLAFWDLTIAIGNLILLTIAGQSFFESQAHEFLLFSAIMFVSLLIFMILAYRYKSNQINVDPEDKNISLKSPEEKISLCDDSDKCTKL